MAPHAQLSSGTVDSDGESIYWEMASTGDDDTRPVVVLSHGAGGTHAVWYQQVPALARDFRVLTWDSRGFGNSTNTNEAHGPDAAAADLAAILNDRSIEQAHLVGQSMGGWHIAAFATAYPHRALSLTFADTVGALWTEELRQAFAEFQARGGLAASRPPGLGYHPALWTGTAERDLAHAFLYQALGSFHSPPIDRLGPTIAYTVEHETIAALDVPVLFVAGEHDDLFLPDLLADSCRRIAGARFVEVADAGHSAYFEQPAVWNHVVRSFLLGD